MKFEHFCFLFSLTSLSRLSQLIEKDHSVGERKRKNPMKNLLSHMQAELGLPHMWPVQGSNTALKQRCTVVLVRHHKTCYIGKIPLNGHFVNYLMYKGATTCVCFEQL